MKCWGQAYHRQPITTRAGQFQKDASPPRPRDQYSRDLGRISRAMFSGRCGWRRGRSDDAPCKAGWCHSRCVSPHCDGHGYNDAHLTAAERRIQRKVAASPPAYSPEQLDRPHWPCMRVFLSDTGLRRVLRFSGVRFMSSHMGSAQTTPRYADLRIPARWLSDRQTHALIAAMMKSRPEKAGHLSPFRSATDSPRLA